MQMDFYYCILVNHFDRSNLRLLICRHRTIVVDWLHRLADFIDDVLLSLYQMLRNLHPKSRNPPVQ